MRQLILAPGKGLSVENPMGGLFTFKITSDESEGALTAIETFIVRPEGPPPHVHDQDEAIYTREGSLRVMLGDTLREVPAGSFVFIPRGTPHTWQNVGAEPLRFFAAIMPAAVAFEEFFKRYAQLPAVERIDAILETFVTDCFLETVPLGLRRTAGTRSNSRVPK
jgi:quercetin dioxygenase-like cupin family protein